MADEIDIMTVM